MTTKKNNGNTTVRRPIHPNLAGKGLDAHPENINRKGRPKIRGMKELRSFAQEFLCETVAGKMRLRTMFEQMARTKGERKVLLEFAFGKAPATIRVEGQDPMLKAYIGIGPDDWDEILKKKDITDKHTDEVIESEEVEGE